MINNTSPLGLCLAWISFDGLINKGYGEKTSCYLTAKVFKNSSFFTCT